MLFPLLALFLNVGCIIFEKAIYDNQRKRYKFFVPVSFLFSFIIIVIFFFPFSHQISKTALEAVPLILLLAIVLIGSMRNMLFYSGFQKEHLSKIEPFVTLAPILTILIAEIFYTDERNIYIFILSMIASLALVFSHIEKKHFKYDKALMPILGAVFLEAIENNLIKDLLSIYSPIALYTVRVGLIALVLFIFIRPSIGKITKKELKRLMLVAVFWVLMMIFYYTSIQTIGVVKTSLILMPAPIFIVMSSYLFLKERKIRAKDVIALIIILICVAISLFIT